MPKASPHPSVAVVVVSYNSAAFLDKCLASLEASQFPQQKVVVIDNNSSDNSVEVARKYQCRVEPLKENLGFAGGNNAALEMEEVKNADYIFLLNPDASVEKDTIDKLVAASGGEGIVQPLILLEDEPQLVNTAGNVLNYLGYSYCGGYRDDRAKYIERKQVAVSSGAAMMIPAKAIQQIGLFDPKFFIYHEDVDFSWRARIAGFDLWLEPSAIAYHSYSFSRNTNKYFYAERNRLFCIAKNYQARTLLLLLPVLLINELAMVAYSLIGGWPGLKLKSLWAVVANLGYIGSERRRIAGLRVRSDRELVKFMTAELDFAEVKIGALRYFQAFLGWYWRLVKGLV